MQVITFKAKPKMIFGIILAVTGVAVILLTFVSNHGGKTAQAVSAPVSCATKEERQAYLSSLGWEFESETQKEVTIPAVFNQVYRNYNALQKKQGFDLETYRGKRAVVYTFAITNYQHNPNVTANLLVSDGVLIGADLCDPSADSGFLKALTKNDHGTTG